MATINAELYDALRAANVAEETARKAALSVASQPDDVAALKTDIAALRVEVRIAIALILAVAVRLFFFPGST